MGLGDEAMRVMGRNSVVRSPLVCHERGERRISCQLSLFQQTCSFAGLFHTESAITLSRLPQFFTGKKTADGQTAS